MWNGFLVGFKQYNLDILEQNIILLDKFFILEIIYNLCIIHFNIISRVFQNSIFVFVLCIFGKGKYIPINKLRTLRDDLT